MYETKVSTTIKGAFALTALPEDVKRRFIVRCERCLVCVHPFSSYTHSLQSFLSKNLISRGDVLMSDMQK